MTASSIHVYVDRISPLKKNGYVIKVKVKKDKLRLYLAKSGT